MRTMGEGVAIDTCIGIAASMDMVAMGTRCGVLLFDMATGSFIRCVGEEGEDEGQVDGCNGLRFTPDGRHILIADHRNSRLSLFSVDGVFVRCMGAGALYRPMDLLFATNGDIVVTDRDAHCIKVLSEDGSSLLRTFGSQGRNPGQFQYPTALAMCEGQLYVIGVQGKGVQVFN